MAEELTFAQKRLWATKIADGMLKVWREEGRTCILMASLPDGRCTISAYETEAEALADKEKVDIQLGQGHSIIRPLDAEPRILPDGVAEKIGDELFDFCAEIPAPLVVGLEEDWQEICMHGGAVSTHVVKLGKTWKCVASFASAEGRQRFAKAWENVGFRIGAGPQDVAAIRNNIPAHLRESFDEGVSAAKGACEPTDGWYIASVDSLEGKILSAVLFDKHREPKLVLLNTSDGAAYDKGIQINAAIVVFVGANPAPQSKRDLWIAGMRFAEGYGIPSERIREQLAQRAIKEVMMAALEEGTKAMGMRAGQA